MCHNTSFHAAGQSINSNFKLCKGGALSEKDETKSYLETDKNTLAFQNQLNKLGLEIRDIIGDGNCLFRSLADQLDGQSENHLYYREKVCEYIESNREDFEPFLLDKCSFEEYLKSLRLPGTYAGNDAIFGFAKLFRVDIVIHQLNRPVMTISHGGNGGRIRELHISYHNNEHYASVRVVGDMSSSPTKFITDNASNSSRIAGSDLPFKFPSDMELRYFKRKAVSGANCESNSSPKKPRSSTSTGH